MVLTTIRNHIKWVLALFCIIFTISIFFTYGAGSRRQKGEGVQNHVVVTIDGKKMYLSDLNKQMQAWAQANNFQVKEDNLHEAYKATVHELATRIALDREVKARGIVADPALVQNRLKELENQYVTKEQFLAVLASQGTTLDKVKENLAHQIAVEEALRQGVGDAKPDEEQVKTLYDLFKSMKHPVVYRPAGIEGDHAEIKTKEKAEAFIADLKSGLSWKDALAKVGDQLGVSTDGTYTSFISDEDLKNTFADTLAKLEDGQVSDPVQIPQGYLVYRRLRHEGEKFLTYEEARPTLEKLVLKQQMAQLQAAYADKLAQSVPVEYVDPKIFEPKESKPADKSAAENGAPAQEGQAPAAEVQGAGEEQSSAQAADSDRAAAPAKADEQKPAVKETKSLGGEAMKTKLGLDKINEGAKQGGLVQAEGKEDLPAFKHPSSAAETNTAGGRP